MPTKIDRPTDHGAVASAAELVLGHPLDVECRIRYLRQFGTPYLCLMASELEREAARCAQMRNELSDVQDRRDARHDTRVYIGRRSAIVRELRRRGAIAEAP